MYDMYFMGMIVALVILSLAAIGFTCVAIQVLRYYDELENTYYEKMKNHLPISK